MEITDDDLQRFQAIWRKEFEESLNEDEARYYASQLLELYALLARPLPRTLPMKSPHSHDLSSLLP